MSIPRFLVRGAGSCVFVLFFLLPASLVSQVDCASDQRYLSLDFLVGRWQVSTLDGQVLGESQVVKRHRGCVLAEAWFGPDGETAETLTYLDPSTGIWHQLGVSSGGGVLRLDLSFADALARRRGELDLDGELIATSGRVRIRGRLEREGDGARESLESSSDGGATFAPLRAVRYRPLDRVSGVAPSAARPEAREEPSLGRAAREPVVEQPAGASGVRSLSARDPLSESIVDVASPMVLDVELGPIERTSEGYSWITEETALYRCEGGTITRIQVSRVARKGKVRVETSVFVRGEARSQRYGLELALLYGDQVVLSEAIRLQAGRGVPSQLQHGAVEKRFSWDLIPEEFDRLFQEGRPRPELRVTLAAD